MLSLKIIEHNIFDREVPTPTFEPFWKGNIYKNRKTANDILQTNSEEIRNRDNAKHIEYINSANYILSDKYVVIKVCC